MKYLAVAILIMTLFSCSEENVEVSQEASIEEMKNNPLQEYIYFEDGDSTYFYYQQDTELPSVYMPDINYTAMRLRRPDDPYSCNIHIGDLDIYTKTFPFEVGVQRGPFSRVSLEHSEIEFDIDEKYTYVDTVNYITFTDSNTLLDSPITLEMEIISFEDDWLTLSFDGYLWQPNSGEKIYLENGEARVFINQKQ